jgi:DNA-binding transcriptional regulator Cro
MTKRKKIPDPEASRVIDALGGTGKVAEMMEITTGAVSQWRFEPGIPKPHIKYFQLLRPDLFERVGQ